jgi:hypothetical protein
MYSALYYPYAEISNESILKTGLLLWDKLEYICPWHGYSQNPRSSNIGAALELIVKPHLPSPEEKRLIHKEVEKLINSELPDWFIFIPENPELRYSIYLEKMLDETWELLLNSNFVVKHTPPHDPDESWWRRSEYVMSSSLGLTLMSIIADCCAGSQKRMITDEVDSYSALTRYITQINDGQYLGLKELRISKTPFAEPHYEKLITVSLKALNLDDIDFQQLISLREREVKQKDTLLRELRRNYFTKLDVYIKQLTEEARHEGDCEEILRTFETSAEDDLTDLKRELKLNVKKTLLSKEVLGAVVAQAFSVVEPISTSLVSVGLLGKSLTDYRANKRNVLKDHSMSWLYMSKPSKIY